MPGADSCRGHREQVQVYLVFVRLTAGVEQVMVCARRAYKMFVWVLTPFAGDFLRTLPT